MGRAPCCDKANVKKGPWSPEEDAKLKSYIEQHGTGGNWIALPQKIGLKRCGKSCRLRWLNYLRPNIKHGGFSEEEDNIICSLYLSIGSRWSVIAGQLPGRTDNDIKNYWNTRLKKKLLGKQRKEQQARNNKTANSVVKRENNGRSTGNSSSLVSENSTQHQHPYNWQQPQMPSFPYTNQGPSFNDQDSIRRLLLKLGGKFSDDDYQHQHQPILHHGFNFQFQDGFQQVHHEDQQVHINGYSGSMNSININNKQAQLISDQSQTNYQFCGDGVEEPGAELVQGEDSFTTTIGEMTSTNDYPQKWLEFLSGDITDNNGQSSNWGGETSTLLYPPFVSSNYQETQTQECVFHGDL